MQEKSDVLDALGAISIPICALEFTWVSDANDVGEGDALLLLHFINYFHVALLNTCLAQNPMVQKSNVGYRPTVQLS